MAAEMVFFSFYRWILAFHVIAVISWMAGILYLFRLYVYHAAEKEPVVRERFKVMERKLYKIIVNPAMGVAFLLGITMIVLQPDLLREKWLHAKLTFVLALAGVSGWAGKIRRDFEADRCTIPEKTFRYLNEVPTLLMILIVILVIVRPF